MNMNLYTHNLFVLHLSPGTIKIKLLQFYLNGIDHFSSLFPMKMNLIIRLNRFRVFYTIHYRLIYSSGTDLVKVFNYFDPVGYVKETSVPEFEINTRNETFQNMVIHAEESFFYFYKSTSNIFK